MTGSNFISVLLSFFFSQSDILDVNEIFRDLASIVNEQGEVVGEFSPCKSVEEGVSRR